MTQALDIFELHYNVQENIATVMIPNRHVCPYTLNFEAAYTAKNIKNTIS